MAGHSHAANIARRKGAQDIKRGKIFTKIAREIIVAAKGGPDINFNAKLRTVVIKARKEGMAKDRIDAAIAKGSGTQVQDVNRLISKFEDAQRMMSQMAKMGLFKKMMKF